MYAARQRHQKHCSFIVAQKVARLARWLERRARTAEPSAGLMAVRSQPHTKHHTYDGRKATPLEESARWKRGGVVKALALAGAAWQSTRGAQGKIRSCIFIKIGNNHEMANHALNAVYQLQVGRLLSAPAKVWRARQFIHRFNSSEISSGFGALKIVGGGVPSS